MVLTQIEIKARAAKFANMHVNSSYEKGETQTFYNDFFDVFGIDRREVAIYERKVKKLNGETGFIDLFWPEVLLVEQKSKGRNLEKALDQLDDYFLGLKNNIRPKYLMVCDFQTFVLIDLIQNKEYKFTLKEFPDKIDLFGFMIGIVRRDFQSQSPVSINASKILAQLYELLKETNYPAHDMEYLLTRLTYCLFADDTGIFEPRGIFQDYIEEHTDENGNNVGRVLLEIFDTLDLKLKSRSTIIDEELDRFPYINGHLFKDRIQTPRFNAQMRKLLLKASEFDWEKISPAIFGSLFQGVLNPEERHESGAHYTTEENIMKVIKPLFLDTLIDEFNRINSRKDTHRIKELEKFQIKLSTLNFFDPACGSGNFLIIAYREIRLLELKILLELEDPRDKRLDVSRLSKVNVDQFYGLEINEFSSRIAETALWMMDHIMNQELSKAYGIAYTRIPLKEHPNIKNVDALEYDWEDLLSSKKCSYILGNPPFAGSKVQTPFQRSQIHRIADLKGRAGTLDYVTGWYFKAGQYANDTMSIGFVSTNSITQGEQVNQLWTILKERLKLDIIFAHKQFKWGSEASGVARVVVIIIGLSKDHNIRKKLFDEIDGKIIEEHCDYITPYLICSDIPLPIVKESSKPINGLPNKIGIGSKPIDDGNYIFKDDEYEKFIELEPDAKPYLKPYLNAIDFLNNRKRWIFTLQNIEPHILKKLKYTKLRIENVKKFRAQSKSKPTLELAKTPKEYHVTVIPKGEFLLIPRVSSSNRKYVPMAYVSPPSIPSDSNIVIQDASLELFGLLISNMHMVWLNVVGGKLGTGFRYSKGMVYTTFPIPKNGYESLKEKAQKILNVRDKFHNSTLDDLYNPNTMPTDLHNAHKELDRAVDRLYRKEVFESDYDRMKFLLFEYKKMIEQNHTLDESIKNKKHKRKKQK